MKFFGWFFTVLAFVAVVTIVTVVLIIYNGVDNDDSEDSRDLFALTIIHINDFHARFEETNEQSLPCREGQKCIGGFARLKTVVDRLKAKRKNSIFLNAGDNFQGTFWYNLLRYNVTSHFLNLLPADAITLGNHEFAHRVGGLIPFLQMLKSPMVVANIEDTDEPLIQNLHQKSVAVERGGRQIGIIGVILRETAEIANTDNLRFTNEVKAIRDEATKLRQRGVNIIIVLSHCGLDRDREIARESGDFIDVIVGGHSHDFFFTPKDGNSPGPDTPIENYPIVVTPVAGINRRVLIVQASAFTKYVGDLTVYFNNAGHVRYFEGNPIFLDEDVEKDPEIERELIPWRAEVDRLGQRVVGHSNVNLMNDECRHGECALGSFAADAFVHKTLVVSSEVLPFASIIQAAGMRSSFPQGDITYGDVVAFMPFENTLDTMQLSGEVLMDVFEHSVSRSFEEDEFIGIHMLQVSGFQLAFNTTKSVGQRLQSAQIRTSESGDFENILHDKLYTVIVASFIANGGDGFTMIQHNRINHRIGLLDIDIIENYTAHKTPIDFVTDGRIVMLT